MTGLWTRVNGREGSRQYRRVDNTQRYVVQSGENFENVPVHSACKAETATPDCVKQRRYTPGWDLIQDEVGSHVMAYLVMVHGKCLGVLLNTRTPMKTGVSSCSASGLVGPSFPQTPKFLRGFRHDTWIVRHTTENLSLSLSLSLSIYIYIYIYIYISVCLTACVTSVGILSELQSRNFLRKILTYFEFHTGFSHAYTLFT